MKDIINDLIQNYLVVILILLFAISLAVGILSNLKKIQNDDKNIKNEGLMGMVYVAGSIFIGTFLLGVLFRAVTGALGSWSI